MSKRHGPGDGSIDARGKDSWRIRYRVAGKRFAITVHGSKRDAQTKLRELLHAGDTGQHVEPSKITLAQWSEQWLALLVHTVSTRTRERYGQLLTRHVLPTLGEKQIQKLTVSEIDALYAQLATKLSPAGVGHVHVALRTCLDTARRKIGLHRNPCDDATRPEVKHRQIGQQLGATDLRRLVDSFKDSTLYPIVALAAYAGLRLGEIVPLRWSDLNPATKELRIERAVETTSKYRRVVKEPKSERSRRTIVLPGDLVEMLLRERARHQRLVAGVSDAADVDLSLVRLADALMFPSPSGPGGPADLTRLRNPKSITAMTRTQFRKLGFPKLRFHDLRGSNASMQIKAGTALHIVAARLGHSTGVLLRSYLKTANGDDKTAADTINKMMQGVL
jgi:integrase